MPHFHFPHHHHRHFPHHLHLAHALILSVLLIIVLDIFPDRYKKVDARSIRIDAVAVFHRAPSYRLRVVSPSATGGSYMDLNITERDKTEILPGEIACIPRPLSDFYENDRSGGTIDYCEIVFH